MIENLQPCCSTRSVFSWSRHTGIKQPVGHTKMMIKYTNFILVFSVLFTALIMLLAGNPSSAGWWKGMPSFFGWACLPYGMLLFLNNIYRGVFRKDLALLITTTVVTGFAVLMLLNVFFIHIDIQGGLVFLFLPAYQAVIAVIGGLIGLALHQRSLNAQPRH